MDWIHNLENVLVLRNLSSFAEYMLLRMSAEYIQRHWKLNCIVPTLIISSQRAAAERVLRQLQEHPDTWTRVVTILQNSSIPNSKFYALQVRVCPCGLAGTSEVLILIFC